MSTFDTITGGFRFLYQKQLPKAIIGRRQRYGNTAMFMRRRSGARLHLWQLEVLRAAEMEERWRNQPPAPYKGINNQHIIERG